jgi:hypothetical protein
VKEGEYIPQTKESRKDGSKITSFKEVIKNSAGKVMKNGFLKSTNEVSANNQKIVISKLEPFFTQKNT